MVARRAIVAAAGLAIFMAQLDTTIVFVALPTIERELAVDTAVAEWVALGYVVPLIALTLMSGRVLDTAGPRRALLSATAGFAAASIAAGLAPTVELLIAARVVQGAAAALLLAAAPVIAVQAADAGSRGRVLGVVSMMASLGAVCGPLLGGQLVQLAGWPSIFFVNAPIALVVAGIAWATLDAAGGRPALRAAWVAEAALIGGAATALLLALSGASGGGQTEWLFALVAVPPLVTAWARSHTSSPVRRLLRTPDLGAAHVALLATYTALMLVQFLAPFYLHGTLDLSPSATGLALLALPAATAVAAPLGGVLTDRRGAAATAAGGAVVLTAALLSTVPLSADWQPADLAWRLAATGAGFGVFLTSVQALVMTRAPRNLLGTATASTNVARQVGIALGPALGTAAWAASAYGVEGMRAAVALATAFGAVAVVALAQTRTSRLAARSINERSPTCP